MTDPDAPQPHAVDVSTRNRLESLKEAIDAYADLLCDHAAPHPGSDFLEEEGKLSIRSPHEVATVVALNALDHLRLIADHALASSRITAFASFTLVRSAITAAGLAGWLLAAEDSKERLRRTLVITHYELSNARTAAREIDGQFRDDTEGNASYNQRLAAVKRVIANYTSQIEKIETDAVNLEIAPGRSKDELKVISSKPSDTDIIREATKLISVDLDYYHEFGVAKEVLRIWRTMSAHAHGLSWAAELTATVTTEADGAILTTWNPQGEDLLQGIQVAWDLMYGATVRYIELLGAQPE
ncbi:hypothetical protein [Nocardia sp. NPDC005998]|uniref:hypothetical protein n=1 Tax=Nocardia sp. NPDC005998 TaxID=3156894 RepID=UPI0033A13E4B